MFPSIAQTQVCIAVIPGRPEELQKAFALAVFYDILMLSQKGSDEETQEFCKENEGP